MKWSLRFYAARYIKSHATPDDITPQLWCDVMTHFSAQTCPNSNVSKATVNTSIIHDVSLITI